MLVIPAIDLQQGRCVRLYKGDFTKSRVYSFRPLEIAIRWQKEGAQYLHIVDLDGAKTGILNPLHLEIVAKIVKLKIPVQFGGGVRDFDTIKKILSKGVDRVILGTKACISSKFIKEVSVKFPKRIAIAADVLDKKIMIQGWQTKTTVDVLDFLNSLTEMGIDTIIYTDVSRDGTLKGIDLENIEKICKAFPSISLIVSGGISSIEDIKSLKDLGLPNLQGIIIGRALYEGKFSLKEAIKAAQE